MLEISCYLDLLSSYMLTGVKDPGVELFANLSTARIGFLLFFSLSLFGLSFSIIFLFDSIFEGKFSSKVCTDIVGKVQKVSTHSGRYHFAGLVEFLIDRGNFNG